MPDQDIVERSLRKSWRPCYRLMKGGHPPEVVANALIKSLADTLRGERGLPGFEDFLRASIQAYSRPDGARTLAEVSRTLEQRLNQQPAVKLLARATQSHLAQIEAGRALPGALPLAEESLRARLRHEFFAKVIPRLCGSRKPFADVAEARGFEEQVWTHLEPQIRRLAGRLTADPSAAKLRAPRSSLRRRTTAELIDLPLSG